MEGSFRAVTFRCFSSQSLVSQFKNMSTFSGQGQMVSCFPSHQGQPICKDAIACETDSQKTGRVKRTEAYFVHCLMKCWPWVVYLTVIPVYTILPTKWRAFVLTSTSHCSRSFGHYDHVQPKREGWQWWLWWLPVSPDSDSQCSLSSHLWLYFCSIVDLYCCVCFRCTVKGFSYIYCCCSVAKSCLTLCDPMDCSTPGFPVLHYFPEFAQIHVHSASEAL